nr:hypothetical protein [Tanacetum cinerariifolium]
MGITTTSPTPQGAAVVAVPSSDRHHDCGLAADSPYSTPNLDEPATVAAAAGKAAVVAAALAVVAGSSCVAVVRLV